MCGVVVIARLDAAAPIPSLTRALDAIAHRGPDGRGEHREAEVALGAVRLAIVDVAGGQQPALGCAGAGVVCVYNGELYNHRELRAALVSSGHHVADACDTSLLPHLYEEHGAAMVERMRGMFAFAVWDAGRKRLLLARDRLGIKPLFYSVTREHIVIASEAKAIFATGLVAQRIDREALDDLFSLGYPMSPRTMFADVREVPPAHTITIDVGSGRFHAAQRYWRAPIPPRGEHRRGSLRTLAGEFREVLSEAVQRHAVADVPVASSLSGGIDSSLVAALAARLSKAPSSTYSLVFPDDAKFDERDHIGAVVDMIGARAHYVDAVRSSASLFPEMIEKLELPLLMPGAAVGLLLAEAARAGGVKVALTGDGADELLGGYDVFRASKARRALSWAGPLGGLLLRAAVAVSGQPKGLAEVVQTARARASDSARAFGVEPPWLDQFHLLDLERSALLGTGGRRVRPCDEAPAGWPRRDDLHRLDPLDAQIAIELETRLPSWILVISDRMMMARGVEARVPFLDDVVVEHALSLPPAAKMRVLREKAVLREAARGLVPERIVNRHKQPFMVPIAPWFFEEGAPDFVDDALGKRALDDAGLFDAGAVARLRAGLARAPRNHIARFRHELVLIMVLGTQLLARGRAGPSTPTDHSTVKPRAA